LPTDTDGFVPAGYTWNVDRPPTIDRMLGGFGRGGTWRPVMRVAKTVRRGSSGVEPASAAAAAGFPQCSCALQDGVTIDGAMWGRRQPTAGARAGGTEVRSDLRDLG
jgi:hypothetical protein